MCEVVLVCLLEVLLIEVLCFISGINVLFGLVCGLVDEWLVMVICVMYV